MRVFVFVLGITVLNVATALAQNEAGTSAVDSPLRSPNVRPHIVVGPGRPRPTHLVRSVPTRRPPRERNAPVRGHQPTPTPTGTPTAEPTQTPLRSATPTPDDLSCEINCLFSVGQVRMTWLEQTGLHFSAFVSPFTCPQLRPEAGETVTIRMTHWLTQAQVDTGLKHTATIVLGEDGTSGTDGEHTIKFSRRSTGWTITYRADGPPLANGEAGLNFPIATELCMKIGGQRVPLHLDCQPKSTGMLCH